MTTAQLDLTLHLTAYSMPEPARKGRSPTSRRRFATACSSTASRSECRSARLPAPTSWSSSGGCVVIDGVVRMAAAVPRAPVSATRLVRSSRPRCSSTTSTAAAWRRPHRWRPEDGLQLRGQPARLPALGVLLRLRAYGGRLAGERYGAHKVLAAADLGRSQRSARAWCTASRRCWCCASCSASAKSVSFPCASKVLPNAVPVERLGVANGVLGFGYLGRPRRGHAAVTDEHLGLVSGVVCSAHSRCSGCGPGEG